MRRLKKIKKSTRGINLWKQAKKIIPGGNQLLSKRAEMFLPDYWPAYFQKAKGVEVWDLDGQRYIDMSIMGIGSCVLGYANPAVNAAVKHAINQGTMCTLNCPEEVELAQKLIQLHPWAGMVRFARTGGEACAIAVRIARAFSGKDTVLFCGYHGWTDWYLASNLAGTENLAGQLLPGLEPRGVPRALRGTAVPFSYGNLSEFKQKIKEYKGKIGVIIMEFQRHSAADIVFLKEVQRVAAQIGAVLVFDETTSGFRQNCGGVHMLYGITPDIMVLGKALGNGFPIAAVVGKKEIMQAAQGTFISSTYWTERIGFTAALEVIRQFQENKVAQHLKKTGSFLISELKNIFRIHDLNIHVEGTWANPILIIHEKDPLVVKTVFTQEMLSRGFLASTVIYLTLAHDCLIIKKYIRQADLVFGAIALAVKERRLRALLKGPVCHSGFRRLA